VRYEAEQIMVLTQGFTLTIRPIYGLVKLVRALAYPAGLMAHMPDDDLRHQQRKKTGNWMQNLYKLSVGLHCCPFELSAQPGHPQLEPRHFSILHACLKP
jgi:hypothetical protein